MKFWQISLTVLTTVFKVVQLQCISPNDDFVNASYSPDLSGITDFGVSLYKQLSSPSSGKNFFFSPYSIWSALTLAYFGSNGNTQRQLATTLALSDKVSTAKKWKELYNLYERRQINNTVYTFNLANRAYFHETLNVRPCMQKLLHKEMRTVDFRDIVGSARDINAFVSETTKGRITEIVQPSTLRDVLMVLVNAAFFKGTWRYQFKPSATSQKPFFINAQDTANMAMMSQKGMFRYGESAALNARVLELPYAGEVISMFLLLPNPALPLETRFESMVRNLNGKNLIEALDMNKLTFQTVDILLPKFRFQMQINDELKVALARMGIIDLFDENLADMSGFALNEDLNIDKTIHKAFIEVNEEGTEAAAATALISVLRAHDAREPKVIQFHCNEPFLFLIHDNQTKNVLFLGAIRNPRG
ncbi:serine-type endopeptidase inhibitor activity protein [Halocaridina rubra]|uniref:Serine-type endopeptidase inhibitor activity protein n=1 Tax=Halocaridina rubra TaxID=373956 RepID=A0AAN8X9V7_HALRR